ncbi:DUF551 domain-containing protein [Acinetobacter indicus]|uniref:DUF551 domain-containing protein n=1 Tax=Acinetobacter indicus TaxID=756892 RepID=UPI000CECCE2D|nr:DUF551 domain-containing protein [Acinetobacter indicus]
MDLQKIKELALANGFKLKEQASGNMDLNAYVYDFANAIEREVKAQAVPEWISVEDQMPDGYLPVLVVNQKGKIRICKWAFYEQEWWKLPYLKPAKSTITHWMPLPDAPQEPANESE